MLSKYILSLFLGFYLVFFILSCINGVKIKYIDYPVYRVLPLSQTKLDVLLTMRISTESIIFLDDTFKIGHEIHVAVAPHRVPDFAKFMDANDIDFWMMMESNLQNALDTDEVQVSQSAQFGYDWTSYYSLNTTYELLRHLARSFSSVTIHKYGETTEKKDLLLVKISTNFNWGLKAGDRSKRPIIFLAAGEHGNEWISPAVATYIISELLTSADEVVRSLAEKYDWYIVPHVNPDGYEYTRTTDPLWSKTRSKHGSCFGVDLNRNWGGSLPDADMKVTPCSKYYQGPEAFSEQETKSLSELLMLLKSQIKLFISLHGFSHKLLYPNSPGATVDVADLEIVSNAALNGLQHRFGTEYIGENDFPKCNNYVGTAMNWVLTDPEMGINMAFTVELGATIKDKQYKNLKPWMQLPASHIIPVGQEFLSSLLNMTNELDVMGYLQLNETTTEPKTLPLKKEY